jgi:hypothetical protein
MQVHFEKRGWDEAVLFFAKLPAELKQALVYAVLDTGNEIKERIQERMPVDTGWAQARWGEPMYGGIWDVARNGLTISLGSDIEPYEYIFRLNEGYSLQAPAGFIDVEAARGEQALAKRSEDLIVRFGK